MKNKFDGEISGISSHALYELKDDAYALNLFSNEHKCLEFIKSNADRDIFFITSGSLGKSIVPKIVDLKQIYAIYIFCGNIQYHMSWALDYVDWITAMIDHEDDLLLRLMKDLSDYLQERHYTDLYNKIKDNKNDLEQSRSIPVGCSPTDRCLSPPDYDTVINEKSQAELDMEPPPYSAHPSEIMC